MEKGQRNLNVLAAAQQETVEQGNYDHGELDPCRGCDKRKDSGNEHLKKSVIRQKREH